MEPIRISYFSDVLCVWAYIAQVRLNELKATFQDKVIVDYHFVSVFGSAKQKLENRWRERDGLQGYSDHVKEVTKHFVHVTIHPEIWTGKIPASSTSCHLFLHAVKLVEMQGLLNLPLLKSHGEQSAFEQATWALREAFFVDRADVANRHVQFEIAEKLGLPIHAIQSEIDSGEAYAELSKDLILVKETAVTVSPTMVFNEGRQQLSGNVGYRVLEANIRELLNNPPNEQSWC